MNSIRIIPVSTDHVEQLQHMSKKIFLVSFFHLNNPEDITSYVEKAFSVEQLSIELQNPDSVFYFAMVAGVPIGYLKLNQRSAQTELKDENGLEIERIYVDAAHQGKKVGQLLLDFAIDQARKQRLDYVWLGVWEHNPGAIRFYERSGFVRFGQHTFMIGNDPQTDFLMKLKL